MSKLNVLAIGTACLWLSACGPSDVTPSRSSSQVECGHTPEYPCSVSAVALLSQPDKFNGREIKVTMYLPGHGATLMFINEEAASVVDYPSAIAALSPAVKVVEPGYYQILGVFYSPREDDSMDLPVSLAGKMHVKNVRKVLDLSRAIQDCPGVNCRIEFVDGVFPQIMFDKDPARK